jgi:hypothetical protein|tara:strand:+ start:1041 stop:1616 length:576 start_codon:yes stop_codon:yes gene_type:complete
MNLDELIYIRRGELDKDFCSHCIEKFEDDDRKYQGFTLGGMNLSVKRSTDLYITTIDGWEEEDKIFYKSLNNNLEYYKEFIDDSFSPLSVSTEDRGYQMQRTKPKEFYEWHHDGHSDRILTFIWYLNNINEGGYTEFNTGYKVQPKTGTLLIFPALWPWVHRGVPPKSETKYICTGWLYVKTNRNEDIPST